MALSHGSSRNAFTRLALMRAIVAPAAAVAQLVAARARGGGCPAGSSATTIKQF
jgi:hypothetical protein